jgi:DNA-directed RNA polymerase specialized sigma subunit
VSEHIEARRKLKEIPSISRFHELLELSTLSPIDKEILRLHYLEHRDFQFIGDSLGYATVTIKRRHAKSLSKLIKLL